MSNQEDFEPAWRIGVYDAHCHPTDIIDSIARIPNMKAKVLTIMSTRAQDQGLVEQTAERMAVHSNSDVDINSDSVESGKVPESDTAGDGNGDDTDSKEERRKMIPAFGWHPWFSHQIYDDRHVDGPNGRDGEIDATKHYQTVLTPSPDAAFLSTLQRPIGLSIFLAETESRLQKFPLALVGEVGLDRSFRLPEGPSSMTGDVSLKTGGDEGEGTYTPGSREGRPLTPYKVNLEQQKMVFKAQLQLAAKLKRAVSIHSVQAHGLVFEVLQSLWKGRERPSKRQRKKRKDDVPNAIVEDNNDNNNDNNDRKLISNNHDNAINHNHKNDNDNDTTNGTNPKPQPYPPRICMHSFSGPLETLRMFLDPKIPADIYISFSECINFNGPAWKKAEDAIRMVPEHRILVESDLHCAGDRMDELLENIVRRVCGIKGWGLEYGANVLKKNWMAFVFG